MTRHDDSQRIDGLAVTQRGGSRLTRIWAVLSTRPRMGTDSIQPSRRLPPLYPTTPPPVPDYPPCTRLPNLTARQPAARRRPRRPPAPGSPRSAAPGRCGADRGTIDPRGTQPCVSRRTASAATSTSLHQPALPGLQREGHICARPRGCKLILKEPHARGVSGGEPGESHVARFTNLTLSGRPSALRARE